MRVFLCEALTSSVLKRYATSVASADVCWSVKAHDGYAARDALSQGKWRTFDMALFHDADLLLARSVRSLVDAQGPLSEMERALLVYGLEARLAPAARVRAALARIRSEEGADRLDLDIVASDPYVRDAVSSRLPGIATLRLHAAPNAAPVILDLRERLAALRVVRSLEGAFASGRPVPYRRSARSVSAFALTPRSLESFGPVRVELEQRGWEIHAVSYQQSTAPGVIVFDQAVRGSRRGAAPIPPRGWLLDGVPLDGLPVPRRLLERALNAAWVTGHVQIERHRRVLRHWMPRSVVSFGTEIMGLALQAAAREIGIPSVFMPHAFLTPDVPSWFLHATATPVFGAGCIQVNTTNAVGDRYQGLIPTGNPAYDRLLKAAPRPDPEAPTLRIPPSRPHIVLLFVEISDTLMGHEVHRRMLEMAAAALPRDAFLLCKLHPARAERELCEDALKRSLPEDAYQIVDDRSYPTPLLLRWSQLAVAAEHSMALIDAIVAGVPSIAVRNPEYPIRSRRLEHPAQAFEGFARLASDTTELRDAIDVLVRDRAERERLRDCRRAYVERFLVAADGCATRRVADLVEHLSAGRRPEDFVPLVGPSLIP